MDEFQLLKGIEKTRAVAAYIKQDFRKQDIQAMVPLPIEMRRECHYIVRVVKEAVENHSRYLCIMYGLPLCSRLLCRKDELVRWGLRQRIEKLARVYRKKRQARSGAHYKVSPSPRTRNG